LATKFEILYSQTHVFSPLTTQFLIYT